MVKYVLGYFGVKGRGEVIRYIFEAAEVTYEDLRFDSAEFEKKYKDKTPFQQCPFLLVDGKMIADSAAITKYLGREFGMMGDSAWEEAMIEQTGGVIGDVGQELIRLRFHTPDKDAREEGLKKFLKSTVPRFYTYVDSMVQSSGYLVGSKLSVADLGVYYTMQIIASMTKEKPGKDASKKVKKFYEKIDSIPSIAAWNAKRPVTDH